jgi:hypothetical protein
MGRFDRLYSEMGNGDNDQGSVKYLMYLWRAQRKCNLWQQSLLLIKPLLL